MSQLVTEGLITLFQLDTRMLGGQIFYFTSAVGEDLDSGITWGGQEYAPLPMDASGFEMTTRGAIPQPNVTISNLFGAGNLLLDAYKGLIGATLTRLLTLRRFLDDGATPDPNAYITRDAFVVSQKTSHNALAIVFKLASQMDQEGVQLPRRQILRDICSHNYRIWDPFFNAGVGRFDYSLATCPYTGSAFYDVNNSPVGPSLDVCQKTLRACRLRFGETVLPARFFPGVGKIK